MSRWADFRVVIRHATDEAPTLTAADVVRAIEEYAFGRLDAQQRIEDLTVDPLHNSTAIWLTPHGIREHFEDYENEDGDWVKEATDDQLEEVAFAVLDSDTIWEILDYLLNRAVQRVRTRSAVTE